MTYFLYDVKGWPTIAREENCARFSGYPLLGGYETAQALAQAYDEAQERGH